MKNQLGMSFRLRGDGLRMEKDFMSDTGESAVLIFRTINTCLNSIERCANRKDISGIANHADTLGQYLCDSVRIAQLRIRDMHNAKKERPERYANIDASIEVYIQLREFCANTYRELETKQSRGGIPTNL